MKLCHAIVLAAGLVCTGCEAIGQQLGLGDSPPSDPPTEVDKLDVGTPQPKNPGKKRRRGKNGKQGKKAKPAPPPLPEAELMATLRRAVIPVRGDEGLYRIDPFVLSLVADTLAREEGLPFTRVTKKERKAGMPAAFRVGELPKPSMWRKLGLRPGDLVLSVEGNAPPGPKRLTALRQTIPREGTLTVEVQRGGTKKTLRYRIEPGLAWTRYLETEAGRTFEPEPKPARGSNSAGKPSGNTKRPSNTPSKPAPVPIKCSGNTCTIPKWYFDSLVGSSSKAKQQVRGKSIRSGYKVTFVGPASRKAGFAVGDVITKVNGRKTNNQLDMLGLYGRLKSTKKFRVEYMRGAAKRTKTILVEG